DLARLALSLPTNSFFLVYRYWPGSPLESIRILTSEKSIQPQTIRPTQPGQKHANIAPKFFSLAFPGCVQARHLARQPFHPCLETCFQDPLPSPSELWRLMICRISPRYRVL